MIFDRAIDIVVVMLSTLEGLTRLGGDPQLLRGVSEEAHLARAEPASIAGARAVTSRVEPVLEHPMRVLARVVLVTDAVPEGRAGYGGVAVPARVAALSLLAAVSVGAIGPVVAPHSRATLDLIGEHPELVGAEETIVMVMVNVLLNRNEVVEWDPIKHFPMPPIELNRSMALSEEERRGRGCIYSMRGSTMVELKLLHGETVVTDVKD